MHFVFYSRNTYKRNNYIIRMRANLSKIRIWYENARYHVMARSVRSMPLYRSEEDYEIFFKMIRKTMEKYPFIIHRGERFISEMDRGLTTYGNSLLFQSGDGNLQELDLDNNRLRCLGKFGPIKYATFIRENQIATVSPTERFVEFNSVRDNRRLKLNSENSKIRSVHAFKTQPFIAVVTSDGMVSMYHVGTGQRTRKLRSSVGFRILAYHPSDNVFTFSDGRHRIETFRYYEWENHGEKRGKWCEPRHPNFEIEGQIIAVGFNTVQKEQIVIETNGKITYMQDRFCDFLSQTKVITNFSVNAYDFSGVICSEEIKKQLVKNGG